MLHLRARSDANGDSCWNAEQRDASLQNLIPPSVLFHARSINFQNLCSSNTNCSLRHESQGGDAVE